MLFGFLVEQEDLSSCRTRGHVFLLNKKTCLLVEQEDMSSRSTRRQVFLLNKNARRNKNAPHKIGSPIWQYSFVPEHHRQYPQREALFQRTKVGGIMLAWPGKT